jgi:hypothetical protein
MSKVYAERSGEYEGFRVTATRWGFKKLCIWRLQVGRITTWGIGLWWRSFIVREYRSAK